MKNIKSYSLYEHNDMDPFGEEIWDDELYNYGFNFIIREPIALPENRECYVLNIRNMHGDGDATSYSKNYFQNQNDLKEFLSFFNWVKDNRIHEAQMKDVFERIFPERDIVEFIHSDATTGHEFLCNIRDISVTYIDNIGVEKRVEVIKNRIR